MNERNIIETRKWISCADPGPSYVLSTKSESVCLTKAMKRKKRSGKWQKEASVPFIPFFLNTFILLIAVC